MFLSFFLEVGSSFNPLKSEKILDILSVFLNLLKLVLCPIMWSFFENVTCTLESMCILIHWDERFI